MVNIFSRKRLSLSASQKGFTHRTFLIVLAVLFIGFSFFKPAPTHASANSSRIKSGVAGYCMDDSSNSNAVNNEVDVWGCNNTEAQTWSVSKGNIIHNGSYCLTVKDNKSDINTSVVLDKCSNESGQVWLSDQAGFYNPNSNYCLSAPDSQSRGKLFIGNCNKLNSPIEKWAPESLSGKSTFSIYDCTGADEGEKIACNAEKEWSTWQSGSMSHNDLLNVYTDNSPYEEWCADFVSYVYKESGYPFTQGEAAGWDESNANNIQNMGFTKHLASSGYIPKPGDVAYFNYENGHVEIVAFGGTNPTFIYGNSGTIDPTTGNGQMKANTITKDSGEGQLIYYLSPN
jgi:hypothetical protein